VETKKFGGVDAVDAAATWDEETGRLALFVANRSLDDDASVTLDLHGFAPSAVRSAEVLTVPDGGNRFSANVASAQDTVGLRPLEGAKLESGALHLTLPALSWSVVELDVQRG
jgi:alpha-N-arabinofuranosidase